MSAAPDATPAPRNGSVALLPWLVAVLACLGMAFFALRTAAARQEAESLRLQLDLRELELRDTRNRREAERFLLNRQIEAADRGQAAGKPPGAAPKN